MYVYSITGSSSHFGAYTGGKLTSNSIIYTTATEINNMLILFQEVRFMSIQ